jgi:hypothetical protein
MASLLNPVGFASPKCDIIPRAAIVDCIGSECPEEPNALSYCCSVFLFNEIVFFVYWSCSVFLIDRCPPTEPDHRYCLVGQQHNRFGWPGLQQSLLGHPQFPLKLLNQQRKIKGKFDQVMMMVDCYYIIINLLLLLKKKFTTSALLFTSVSQSVSLSHCQHTSFAGPYFSSPSESSKHQSL